MDFPEEKLLEKYVNIYEEYIADYVPDFEVKDGTTRYVRFNDAWRGLNPFEKLLITRLINRKNTFPKKASQKLPKNANPENYVRMKYDSDGNLKVARIGEGGAHDMGIIYVSKQLTVGYILDYASGGEIIPSLYNFERVPDGLEYTSNYYFRRSQTLTDKGHISEDTITHLAENGIRLV